MPIFVFTQMVSVTAEVSAATEQEAREKLDDHNYDKPLEFGEPYESAAFWELSDTEEYEVPSA